MYYRTWNCQRMALFKYFPKLNKVPDAGPDDQQSVSESPSSSTSDGPTVALTQDTASSSETSKADRTAPEPVHGKLTTKCKQKWLADSLFCDWLLITDDAGMICKICR